MSSVFEDIKNNFKGGNSLTKLIYINVGVFLIASVLRVLSATQKTMGKSFGNTLGQVIWKHTGPSTRGCFEKTHVVFTAKSFGNTLGLAQRCCLS
jgi:hypothetical protein